MCKSILYIHTDSKDEWHVLIDGNYLLLNEIEINSLASKCDTICGHGFYEKPWTYDVICNSKAMMLDLKLVSFYLNDNYESHSIDVIASDANIDPVVMLQAKNNEDVMPSIIKMAATYFMDRLKDIYVEDKGVQRLLKLLEIKGTAAIERTKNPLRIDVEKAVSNIEKLTAIKDKLELPLIKAMPKSKLIHRVKKAPEKPWHGKNGLLLKAKNWIEFCEQRGFDPESEEVSYMELMPLSPNPGSPKQVKEWLKGKGWKPKNFEINQKGLRVPKILIEEGDQKNLCSSLSKLEAEMPFLKNLCEIGVVKQRIGQLKSMVNNAGNNGDITSTMSGFTNTLRVKHKVVANLTKTDKKHGQYIREIFVSREGKKLVGFDLSSLESMTRNHFIYGLDPEYVGQMMSPDFDSHLDLAEVSGCLTKDDVSFCHAFNKKEEQDRTHEECNRYKLIMDKRTKFKTINYACLYGASAKTISKASGYAVEKSKEIVDAYARRNWAVNSVAESLEIKKVGGKKWLFNPTTMLWYPLRNEKDKFSTLNQSTGAFFFDIFSASFRRLGYSIMYESHDENLAEIEDTEEAQRKVVADVEKALNNANKAVKMMVNINADVKFGYNYAEVH